MNITDHDLVCGALSLAYAYTDLPGLLTALRHLESSDETTLLACLEAVSGLSERRARKLGSATRLMLVLREAAIYGTVALQNKLISEDMLNACLEENRRRGFASSLGEVLREKGVVDAAVHAAIDARAKLVLDSLAKAQQVLVASLDLSAEDREELCLRLEVLMGEVATKLSFLTRDRLEEYLGESAPRVAAPRTRANEEISETEPIVGYEILDKLGQGAMGAVFKAVKKDTKEVVALKVLKPDLSNDREFVQRFLREAESVAQMNHENVVKAIQVGKSGKFYYFAMEFIDGEPVSEFIRRQGKLSEELALNVCMQVAAALAHAWRQRIIHRDVKPDNIMLTRSGTAKLTDLGIARSVAQSTLTLTGVVMGSPAYISPEQATGEKNLDNRSDIYSLGASLYHMLTGGVPYDGDSPLQVMLKHMNDPLPDVRARVPSLSEGTRQLVFKMLAKRPDERFQSAGQLQEAIGHTQQLLSGTSIEELTRSQVMSLESAETGGSDAGDVRRQRQREIGDRLKKFKKKRG